MSLSAAYAAGLLDGEGCLYLTSNRRKGKPAQAGWSAAIEVGMTTPAIRVLYALRAEWGGAVRQSREATEQWDNAFHWKLFGAATVPFLEATLPHIQIKREQAETLLLAERIKASLVPQGKQRPKWTAEASARVAALAARVKEVNRRGPTTTPKAEVFALLVGEQWVHPQPDLFGDLQWEKFSGTWPDSGMMRGGVSWIVNSSEWPKDAAVCSLSDVLEPEVDSRYLLSPKACSGILRRAEKRGKELPRALREALEARAAA